MDTGRERPSRFGDDRTARTQKLYLAQLTPKLYLGEGCEKPQQLDSDLACGVFIRGLGSGLLEDINRIVTTHSKSGTAVGQMGSLNPMSSLEAGD